MIVQLTMMTVVYVVLLMVMELQISSQVITAVLVAVDTGIHNV
jgi:hypothetical protein